MDCHATGSNLPSTNGSIALVGHHNVGKSVLFTQLTGRRTITANFPGTTVEITRGESKLLPGTMVVDTPGVVTLPPRTEDEQVTARVLFQEPLKVILQVGDAKNLRRTLLLTTQLAEMGIPMVLALNMMDEANTRGVAIDNRRLAEQLSVPVVPTIATRGRGLNELKAAIQGKKTANAHFRLQYQPEIEAAVADIIPRLPEAQIDPRALALLWLRRDPVAEEWLQVRMDPTELHALHARRENLQLSFVEPVSTVIQKVQLEFVERLASTVLIKSGSGWQGLGTHIGHLATHPVWGLPILALVLYALYWFVGVFGAGTLVDLLETKLFGEVVNPWVTSTLTQIIPIPIATEFIVGEYGLWTMGMTYALALILPIVSTFFLAFGLLEDSGYLPRLSVLSNRLFRMMGLNGKAVIPMVLGLGCVTMATLTTRILESRRERMLAILLLALAIPCSAQLGVIMGMLAGTSFMATVIWSFVILGVLLLVGWITAMLIPGERSLLMVELPPLRRPLFSNVIVKTLSRLEWYLKEVVPLFLIGTAFMFAFDQLGVLTMLIRIGEPLVTNWLGLPPETSAAFVMGFLRRDFGATGLFMMNANGLLTPAQVVVAMVTITLFIPCVASVIMIAKERSVQTALAVTAVIFPLAFMIGGLLNRILLFIGWGV